MSWTCTFRSLINPIGFVVVWYAILILYGASLGFGSPNLNLNYYVIILTPKPPFSNTSSIVFFPICTWITTICLSITTAVVPNLWCLITNLFICGCFYLNVEFSFILTSIKDIFLIQKLFKILSQAQNITCF
jgi:hypothetical protein